MGYPVFYSDNEAKLLLENDAAIQLKISNLLGSAAFINKKPDRKYIAAQVFKNQQLLSQLNQIIHPAVRQQFDTWKKLQTAPLVFNEAAILFETGAYKNFDKSILVTAPEAIKIQRVMARDHISYEEVNARIANQWTDEEKIKLADFVVVNDDKNLVLPQVIEIINKLK